MLTIHAQDLSLNLLGDIDVVKRIGTVFLERREKKYGVKVVRSCKKTQEWQYSNKDLQYDNKRTSIEQ
jgi:hypothetical protein